MKQISGKIDPMPFYLKRERRLPKSNSLTPEQRRRIEEHQEKMKAKIA